jgi:hypothetical protein
MTELTIRRIAMGLIANYTRYLADLDKDERMVALASINGVVQMANELIAVCGTGGDA